MTLTMKRLFFTFAMASLLLAVTLATVAGYGMPGPKGYYGINWVVLGVMTEKQYEMWEAFSRMNGERVAQILTTRHGMKLLDEVTYQFMVGEGYIEPRDERREYEKAGRNE